MNSFVHKNTLNYLVFNKGSNSLRLRQYGADGKVVDLEYILPQTKAVAYANTTYADIKNLSYRSTYLADPTILCNKQHIYMADDAMYLVYPKFTGSSEVFIIVKLGLNDGKLSKNIVYHANATNTNNTNLYFANNSFLHYTSSLSQITLTRINPVNWEKKELYTLSENDEKLNDIPMRQEDTTVSYTYPSGIWHLSGDKNKKVTQKKLLRKVYNGGESYVYVHPTKDSINTEEIVLGRYGVYQYTSGSGLTTMSGVPANLIDTNKKTTHHRYVVLEHDKRTGKIQPTQAAIKSLAELANDTTDDDYWITVTIPGFDKKTTPSFII